MQPKRIPETKILSTQAHEHR